jgi:metal-responsive CopG/Arc/MetJ family transcriptional regulator
MENAPQGAHEHDGAKSGRMLVTVSLPSAMKSQLDRLTDDGPLSRSAHVQLALSEYLVRGGRQAGA